MHGPKIFTRSLSVPAPYGKSGALWQYHSRGDRHSKIGCWGILFDLLLESASLREHVSSGSVCFGLNHEMRDFKMDRKKNLDLVLCTPGGPLTEHSFEDLVERYGVVLSTSESVLLKGIPRANSGPVGTVRMALEAKACMTEHSKALPRLHDELNSSHRTIHGSAAHAIAVGFAVVNVADTFVSSDRNKLPLLRTPPVVTTHKQPAAAEKVIAKLGQLARRTKADEEGFDALGIVVVDCRNDGSAVRLVTSPPAPPAGDIFEYSQMIRRVAALYDSRYR